MENSTRRPDVKKFSNVWQTLVLILAIASMGFTVNDKLDDALFTKEEVKIIATDAAQEVIYSHKQDIAVNDAGDFIQGWIESDGVTMVEYITNCYEYKTRVYKGGLLLVDNEFETRDIMIKRYGKQMVEDLIKEICKIKF